MGGTWELMVGGGEGEGLLRLLGWGIWVSLNPTAHMGRAEGNKLEAFLGRAAWRQLFSTCEQVPTPSHQLLACHLSVAGKLTNLTV